MTIESSPTQAGTATDDFEKALRTLVLEAFAEGIPIEHTWEITSPSVLVPNWRITIEKTTDAALPSGDIDFLDE